MVVDSVVPLIERYGMGRIVRFLRVFDPGVDVYCTSLWYLPVFYSSVKVVRSGERVMAVGYRTFLDTTLSEIARFLDGGVEVGIAGRLST